MNSSAPALTLRLARPDDMPVLSALMDRAIGELKSYFNRLLRPAAKPARRGPQRRKKGKTHA